MNTSPLNSVFQYSLLNYRHSLALDEVLTVGILVVFPEQAHVRFLYPEKLARLKHSYRDAPEKTLRAYFCNFTKRADQLNQQPDLFASFFSDQQGFVFREFLPADGSALQFGTLKTSVQYTDDFGQIEQDLYRQYLSFYDAVQERHDYEQSLKIYRDLKGVIDTAYYDGKADVAKKLKDKGMATDFISETTGLTQDEIDRLWPRTPLITPQTNLAAAAETGFRWPLSAAEPGLFAPQCAQ